MARGDYSQAMTFMTESLAINKELKLPGGVAFVLSDLGKAALAQGEYQQAVAYFREALTFYWDWGSERKIAEGLEQLASAVMHGHVKMAVRLLGTAEAVRESCSAPIFPFQVAYYEHTLTLLRPQLDEAAFATCWAEGRAMNIKQAVQYAFGESYE